MNNKKILLTGGGTAGHVTPNIALLPGLRRLGFEIHYIGTAAGIERELCTREQVCFHAIPAGKLRRYIDIRNITDVLRIVIGFFKALYIVAKVKPRLLFSKGGFVSCPVVWASWLCRVPVIIHESDISPGLANKLSLPFAKKICYSFPETAAHLPKRKSVRTGIPVRETLFAGNKEKGKKICGFSDMKPVIMVTGGSQGAQAINACVRGAFDRLLPEFNVCHICGSGNKTADRPGVAQFEYVNNELADLFALADVVISRAGATTLFELLALQKPALLIPLPLGASRGDQILNARSFEKQRFCRVLEQEKMTPETLAENIRAVHRERTHLIDRMKQNASMNGVENVLGEIIQLVGKRGNA
jgi:UDP-N-acetylglucosamine--N-acetylmuramyl-(pentapeptide) pyrophosphoryl-undecaprenol N-acetylglucosamine transferase